MAFDEQLAARIRQCLAHCEKIEERKMFGCIAFMIAGYAVAGVWKRSLIARVGPNGYEEALLEPHVREFDITGKPMRGWVAVGSAGIKVEEQLTGWVQRALEFAETLHSKRRRR